MEPSVTAVNTTILIQIYFKVDSNICVTCWVKYTHCIASRNWCQSSLSKLSSPSIKRFSHLNGQHGPSLKTRTQINYRSSEIQVAYCVFVLFFVVQMWRISVCSWIHHTYEIYTHWTLNVVGVKCNWIWSSFIWPLLRKFICFQNDQRKWQFMMERRNCIHMSVEITIIIIIIFIIVGWRH